MKLNKKISKLLALGMLTNNLYFGSNANSDIPNRYETLEGEYITIDDSMEGNLEEIEIFGDTWQDSDSPNIFDGKLEKGYYDITNGVKFDSDVIKRSSNFTPYEGTFVSNKNLTVLFYDSNYNYLEYTQASPYKTDNTNAKYFKIHYNINVCPGDDVMINLGTKLLDYVPYHKADLSNIQSVGDLHVDKDGNPILDSQGREQYKIDIVSNNKNLNSIDWHKVRNNDAPPTWGNFYGTTLKLRPNTTYYITISNDTNQNLIDDGIYSHLVTDYHDTIWVSHPQNNINGNSSRAVKTGDLGEIYFKSGSIDENWLEKLNKIKIQIELGSNKTNYTLHQGDKVTILLPTQLQKVGDVADRLYWDNEKGRYVIEKNIEKIVIDENMSLKHVRDDNGFSFYNLNIGYSTGNKGDNGRGKIISNWTVNNTITGAGQYYGVETSVTSGGQSDTITVSINTDDLNSVGGISSYMMQNPCVIYHARYDWQVVPPITVYSLKSEIIETNITSKLKIPTYDEKTHIYVDSKNSIDPNLKVVVDRLPQIAKSSVEEAENNSTSYNISLARMYVNMLPESLYKDQLHEQLNQVFSSDITLDRETSSANLDIYVKSENMLSLSLDTNSVTFEGYSGVEDVEMLGAVSININSSLPYSLNVYMPVEIANSDKSNILPMNLFNIKESSESDYKQFANTTDKIVLKDNCNAENNSIHNIDLKLASNQAHKADIYKSVIKFEAEQK